jgi:hypothetical protein
MKTLRSGGGVDSEDAVRCGVAVTFVVGMVTFYVWFIATHLTRYGN